MLKRPELRVRFEALIRIVLVIEVRLHLENVTKLGKVAEICPKELIIKVAGESFLRW
jgi:hypothetical protein